MKLRLLEHLRCPKCRSALRLQAAVTESIDRDDGLGTRCAGICGNGEANPADAACAECAKLEVMRGLLACGGCAAIFEVRDGVPRLHAVTSEDVTRQRTADSFGYLWGKSVPGADVYNPASYHFAKMEKSLSLSPPRGLVLDAGCGDGIDLANQAQREGVEAVGVELSEGGSLTSYARTLALPRAHVVQADVCRLPFADATFDLAYSYGVLHHLGAPEQGLREMVRVARPGATVSVYLYEDFSERSSLLRWSLAVANHARAFTTRLPHRALYLLCHLWSPIVFAVFTVLALIGRRVPGLASLARGLPFRHGTGPFSLVGDLYDRFSAPVEWRYSRESSARFFADAGLERVSLAVERGWMVAGTKPPG